MHLQYSYYAALFLYPLVSINTNVLPLQCKAMDSRHYAVMSTFPIITLASTRIMDIIFKIGVSERIVRYGDRQPQKDVVHEVSILNLIYNVR